MIKFIINGQISNHCHNFVSLEDTVALEVCSKLNFLEVSYNKAEFLLNNMTTHSLSQRRAVI